VAPPPEPHRCETPLSGAARRPIGLDSVAAFPTFALPPDQPNTERWVGPGSASSGFANCPPGRASTGQTATLPAQPFPGRRRRPSRAGMLHSESTKAARRLGLAAAPCNAIEWAASVPPEQKMRPLGAAPKAGRDRLTATFEAVAAAGRRPCRLGGIRQADSCGPGHHRQHRLSRRSPSHRRLDRGAAQPWAGFHPLQSGRAAGFERSRRPMATNHRANGC